MITREFLLENDFYFRCRGELIEGEYCKRIGKGIIIIRYSNLYKWSYEIINTSSHFVITADCQDVIYIDNLQKLLDLANIEYILKKPESIQISDFHKNIDFAVLFNFGDVDYYTSIVAAAKLYCDEFNHLLKKIDEGKELTNNIDDFNKLCKIENVKEIMKCGFMSEQLSKYSKTIWKETFTPTESSFNKIRSDLDYIMWNGRKKIYTIIDGNPVISEMDNFIIGSDAEIATAVLKYGEPISNPDEADMFPVDCNGEVLLLYMKDGFLTYAIR